MMAMKLRGYVVTSDATRDEWVYTYQIERRFLLLGFIPVWRKHDLRIYAFPRLGNNPWTDLDQTLAEDIKDVTDSPRPREDFVKQVM